MAPSTDNQWCDYNSNNLTLCCAPQHNLEWLSSLLAVLLYCCRVLCCSVRRSTPSRCERDLRLPGHRPEGELLGCVCQKLQGRDHWASFLRVQRLEHVDVTYRKLCACL